MREYLHFASERQRDEWEDHRIPGIVRAAVFYIADARWSELQAPTVVTSVWRSEAEERALGGKGVHLDFRAVDLDADEEVMQVEEAIRDRTNRFFPTGLSEMPRVAPLRHGTGPHFHVQATKAEAKARGGVL